MSNMIAMVAAKAGGKLQRGASARGRRIRISVPELAQTWRFKKPAKMRLASQGNAPMHPKNHKTKPISAFSRSD